MTLFVIGVVIFLALANASNDNFKGVATLYGSGSASYRVALAWATATTLLGSLLTFALSSGVLKTFSARGLVPEAVASSPILAAQTKPGKGKAPPPPLDDGEGDWSDFWREVP